MRRRDFLQGGTSAALLACTPLSAQLAAAPTNRTMIDIHCHVFNGDDLPIEKFLEGVVIRSNPGFNKYATRYGNAIHFLVGFAADWVRKHAPDAARESELLDRIEQGNAQARTRSQIEADEIRLLSELIETLKNLRIRGQSIRFRERVVSSYLPGIVIGLMHREAFPLRFTGKTVLDNSDGAYEPENWSPPSFLAQHVYTDGKGDLSRYLRWAVLFTRFRFELVDELDRIHGARPRLLTPALVDFSRWINDDHDVKLADQVRALGKISQRPGPLRVHGCVAFCPLREALHRSGSLSGSEAPLELDKRAVREEGFIGVKLYPPMGFLPLENEKRLSHESFPRHLPAAFRQTLGSAIDQILRELYGWCVAEAVPILAHAADTYGAEPGYSSRANPENWSTVVREYKTLRLALAHFGDFDEGFATPQRPARKLADTWDWKMANLAHDPAATHVFIDLSYFRAPLLPREHKVRVEVVRMMKATLKEFASMKDRLLFGSDWIMFGQEQDFPAVGSQGRYAGRVFDLMKSDLNLTDEEVDRIRFKNAASYLGLNLPDRQANNRSRLGQFYRKHNLDSAWLDAFS